MSMGCKVAPDKIGSSSEDKSFHLEPGNREGEVILTHTRVGGKFKLELFFGPTKSNRHSFLGIVTVWQSHSDIDGDSDVLISLCPKCKVPILEDAHMIIHPDNPEEEPYPGAICHRCGTKWRIKEVIQYVGAVYDLDGWADLILKYYEYLGGDMDIYLKRFSGQLHRSQLDYQENPTYKNWKKFQLDIPRKYELAIYSMSKLIEDTATGRDLKSAVRAFLAA